MKELFEKMLAALRAGDDAVLCSIIAASGSTPRRPGAKMAVFADGTFTGTIGGGTVEYAALQQALDTLSNRRSCTGNFQICEVDGSGRAMTCGGDVTVYFQLFQGAETSHRMLVEAILELLDRPVNAWLITELGKSGWSGGLFDAEDGFRFLPPEDEAILRPLLTRRPVLMDEERRFFVEPVNSAGRLYVFGGGHVSQALVPLLTHVGFRVTVLESRPEFADRSLFPTAEQVVQAEFSNLTKLMTVTEQDGILIMTRGRRDDYEVVRQALATSAGYVGVIGSRRKAAVTLKRLHGDGVAQADLARLHTPIGLPIGAETPEEIAVSVTAELIQYRAACSASDLR